MRIAFLAVLAAVLITAAAPPAWAPEPGMGRGNDHNSNAGGSNSSPGHEGSSNRSAYHQRSSSGYFTNDPATRSRDQFRRSHDRHGNPSSGPRGGGVTPGSQDRNF